MKIAVLIKQAVDVGSVRIESATGEPKIGGSPVMNTSDAHAVSESIDLRETTAGEVVAISVGPELAREELVEALATGADSALHVICEELERSDSLSTARAITEAVREEGFDVLLAGHKADDFGTGQVGLQIAEMLGIRHLSNVTAIAAHADFLHVTRDADGFPEELDVQPPVLLILAPREDAPKRHSSLRGMMQAKRKPVREVEPVVPMDSALTWTAPMAQRVSADRVLLEGEPVDEAAAKLAAWLRQHRLVG
jgi:electron transfer flavoprotein alpha/beta subunit